MALLDVDQALHDPDFTDYVTVIRRQQSTDNYGRLVTNDTVFTNVAAVITVNSPNDLYREEDFEYFMRTISVITQFRLRGQTENYQPDIVVWRGNQFVLQTFDPYPQFGQGFFQAICASMDRNDNALDQIYYGKLNFSTRHNSGKLCLFK